MIEKKQMYAGFGIRALALAVDVLISILPFAWLQTVVPFVAPFVYFVFYKCVFLSSAARATPGKRLFEIEVTTLDGDRISFSASVIRGLFESISFSCCGIGHLFALFNPQKQTLHDMLAKTVVVYGRTAPSLLEAWTAEMMRVVGLTKDRLSQTIDRTTIGERERLELLDKLNELRRSGAITEEEFQKKKAELLKST